MSLSVFLSQPSFVNVNEKESNTAEKDTGSTEVVASFVTKTNIDVTGNRNSKTIRNCLRTLNKSPGSGKVSGTDFFINVHFERIIVASSEYPIDPNKHDIALVTLAREAIPTGRSKWTET